MNTPKNRRLQQLTSSVSIEDLVLRRRSASNTPKAANLSLLSPNSSHVLQSLIDDEADRRASAGFDQPALSESGNESIARVAEAADSLSNCLKLFAENKINKENAWHLNIIDSFAKLLTKHHKLMSNFQVAGQSLEASAKVYGLRVDSVYHDVLRMTADLARQSAQALTKKGNRRDEANDGSDREEENNQNNENPNTSNEPQSKAKKIRKRRIVSTVTKNPETLNGRLETNPMVDPFFAKLNSVIGEMNNSKRLMQNVIPTENSKLKLRQNLPVWDSSDQAVFELDEDVEYKKGEHQIISSKSLFPASAVLNNVLRQELSTYRVTNTPLGRSDDTDVSFHQSQLDDLNNTAPHGSTHVGLQFDINADVEPVPPGRSMVMDYGDMHQDDFDDLNDMDLVALERCKGLRRQPVVIEDMQPESASVLEYSYRPLEHIDRFWAGPSHWKFRENRRTGLSMGASRLDHPSERDSTGSRKRKIVRKRKVVKKREATLEDVADIDDNVRGVIVKIIPGMRGTRLAAHTIAGKWDPKKNKLPCDYRTPLDIFMKILHAPHTDISANYGVTHASCHDDNVQYDFNNNEDNHDRDYGSLAAGFHPETDPDVDMDHFDQPNQELVDEIPDVFVGAPERIEKIHIAFAKRAKLVDMKQLKQRSWELINKKHESDPLNPPKFSEIVDGLPKVLNRQMAESLSMPLAFYSILHLCNDKGLVLNQCDEEMRDFEIKLMNQDH